MGRCWRCDTELRLIGNQWLCDNCNEPIGYRCWKCGFDFTIRDVKTKKNIEECGACGFYYCPSCHSCAIDCPKIIWTRYILNILAGQTTLDGTLLITKPNEKIQKIVSLIENLKKEEKKQKVCPYFVYASYARGRKGEPGRIKQLLKKMNGIGVKNELDTKGFKEKFDKILGILEGNTFTIKQLREEGRYGQEERDACNLGVCMGEVKAELVLTKDKKKAIVYTKIKNNGKCAYLRQDNLIIKKCLNCKIDYNNPQLEHYQPNIDFCPKCIYKKGKKKNTHYQLKIRETNTFICNCPYIEFKVVEKEDEDGDTE